MSLFGTTWVQYHCFHATVANFLPLLYKGRFRTSDSTQNLLGVKAQLSQSIIFFSLCCSFIQSGHREPVDSVLLLSLCQPAVPALWWLIKKLWNSTQLSLSPSPTCPFYDSEYKYQCLSVCVCVCVCMCMCVLSLIWLQTQVINKISLRDLSVKSQLAWWVCGCGDVSPTVQGSIC